jgi:hypothetical protein
MLRAIERKHVTASQWQKMLLSKERFTTVIPQSITHEPDGVRVIVMSWNEKNDQPDGRFIVAFGRRTHTRAVKCQTILWVGFHHSVRRRWTYLLRQACKIQSPTLVQCVKLCIPPGYVRCLHRLGFRIVHTGKELQTLISLIQRLPDNERRSVNALPCITDINSLLFLEALVKMKLVKEMDDLVPMYLHV